jgi:O-antigen/teichoic acid export membrane protein
VERGMATDGNNGSGRPRDASEPTPTRYDPNNPYNPSEAPEAYEAHGYIPYDFSGIDSDPDFQVTDTRLRVVVPTAETAEPPTPPADAIGQPAPSTNSLKAIGNSVGIIAAQIINKLVTYIAFIIAAAALSVEDFSIYVLILTGKELLNSITTFGWDQVLIRTLSHTTSAEARKRLLRDGVALKLIASLACAVVIIIAMYIIGTSADVIAGTIIVVGDLILANLGASLMTYYRARLDARAPTIAQAIARATYLIALAVAARMGGSWLVMLELLLLSDAAICIILTVLLSRRLGHVGLAPDRHIRSMLPQVITLGIAGIGILAYHRLDTFLIAQLGHINEVGYYSAAYKLTEAPLAILVAVSTTVLPLVSYRELDGEVRARVAALTKQALRYGYALSLLAAVGLTVFAPLIVRILYGPRFESIVPAVIIMAWSTVGLAINNITSAVLTGIGRQRILLPVVGVNLVINLVLNVLLIPHWGYLGSSVVTTVTEDFNVIVQVVILCIILRRISLIGTTVLAFILGTVCLVGIFGFNIQPTLVEGAITIIVLCVILFATRVVTKDDMRRLAQYGQRFFQRISPRRKTRKSSQEQVRDPSVSIPM